MSKEEKILSCIEIDPPASAQYTIIWLHGLGADGSDFVPIVSELRLPPALRIRFVFPHAPMMSITINNGYKMRAWYDILGLTVDRQVDHAGVNNAVYLVEQLIEKEVTRGIPTNHIILAGFSQGAVIALVAGLRYAKPLGGILALSGYLPAADELIQTASLNQVNRYLSIFIAHGTNDPIVPYALGEAAYVALKQADFPISWHSYPMAHAVCATEINDISQWIQERCKSILT